MTDIKIEINDTDESPLPGSDKKKEKKEKKEKKKGGSRIHKLSLVRKERRGSGGMLQGATAADGEDGNDTENEIEGGGGGGNGTEGAFSSSGGDVPTKTRLTMAQVKDRTLSVQSHTRRKRSATDGASALLGSIRRGKKKESAEGATEEGAEGELHEGSSKKEKKNSDGRGQRNSVSIQINDECSGEGGSESEARVQKPNSMEGEEKRSHMKRSGSLVDLKKQVVHVDRGRMQSRDTSSVGREAALERFVSLKSISVNFSSVFGAVESGRGDKSPRRVSSTPESFTSSKKVNPLWVLSQKAKQNDEEKEKRERQEQRKREREILPVGDDVPDKQRKRNRVINEIVSTERDYVEDLKAMITYFRNPLEDEGILTKEEVTAIFSNLTLLRHVNSELLADISKKVKESNGDDLGQSFSLLADYLKMYSQYCSNQTAAREAVATATKTNARFRAFQEKMAVHPELNGLTLRDYLIKPVQRLCKYPLLIRELIKNTEESHGDYQKLKEAFEKIESVVTMVNEKKQADEEREAVARIISRLANVEKFGVQLMVPGRSLIQEGKLLEMPKERSEPLRRHYILFSDLLILAEDKEPKNSTSARRKESNWKVSRMIPFAYASLKNLPCTDGDESRLVEIKCDKPPSSTTIRFNDEDDLQEWVQNVQEKIHKVRSLSARSRNSTQLVDDLGMHSAVDRVKAPSPPSGPAAFSATSLSP